MGCGPWAAARGRDKKNGLQQPMGMAVVGKSGEEWWARRATRPPDPVIQPGRGAAGMTHATRVAFERM